MPADLPADELPQRVTWAPRGPLARAHRAIAPDEATEPPTISRCSRCCAEASEPLGW
jgi:hypothetical protein